MKYRIKSIKRKGWVETEKKLYRPAEEVTPIVLPEEPPVQEPADDTQIYIMPDTPPMKGTSAQPHAQEESTVLFTPPTLPPLNTPDANEEKKPLIPFLKTKESKILAGVIGGFALLLIILIVTILLLGSSTDKGDKNSEDTTPTADHKHEWETNEEKSVAATCTKEGTEYKSCKICGVPKTEETIKPLGHDMKTDNNKSKKATCTEDGINFKKCTRCGESEAIAIDKLEHEWETDESKSRPATCKEDGITYKVCKLCDYADPQTISKLKHEWENDEEESEPATCEEDGVTVKKCKLCNASDSKPIEATGHDLIDTIVEREPTCTSEGEKVSTCTNCDKRIPETIPIDPDKHDNIESATCQLGEKCTGCGTVISDPIDHSYKNGLCVNCNSVKPFTEERAGFVSLGDEITLSDAISITIEGYYISGDSLILNVKRVVNDNYLSSMYSFAPEAISVYYHDDYLESPSSHTATDNLFDISSSGTGYGTITVDYSGNGEYLVQFIGEITTHTYSIAVLD